MDRAIVALLILVGLINTLPVIGVISAARIASGYAVEVSGPDLEILLRHRALLFGVVGGFILYAAWFPLLHWPAIALAAVSMTGFLLLAWSVGGYNAALGKVALADVVGLVLLAVATLLKLLADQARLPGAG